MSKNLKERREEGGHPLFPLALAVAVPIWTEPTFFLPEADQLPWNTRQRVIDPCFVVEGKRLHCYFVGSCDTETPGRHANLLGHAVTMDPQLSEAPRGKPRGIFAELRRSHNDEPAVAKAMAGRLAIHPCGKPQGILAKASKWDILTKKAPLIGRSAAADDGIENVTVFKTDSLWTMIYSEGLLNQHLAYAQSSDLIVWKLKGQIELPCQSWMKRRYGAPFVWKDGKVWLMLLMGEDEEARTRLGLLSSQDGIHWDLLPESS